MRLVKNTGYTLVSNIAGGLAFFLVNAIVARWAGASVFGSYTFIFAFLSFFVVIANLGLDTIVVRELSKKTQTGLLASALMVKFITSTLAALTAGILVTMLGYDALITRGVWIASLTLITGALTNTLWTLFQARFEMFWYAVTHTLGRVLILLMTILFIFTGHGMLWLVGAHAITGVVQAVLVGILVKRRTSYSAPSLGIARILARESWPLALSTLFISLYYRLDVLMLSFWNSQADIGYYAAVYTMTEAPAMIAVAWNATLYPLLSSIHNQKNLFVQWSSLSVKAMVVFALPLAVGTAVLSPEIIRLVYGNGYDSSIPVLRVLIWGGSMIMINVILSSMLNALGFQRITTLATGINLLLNGLLNLWAIPAYGIVGAAATTVATEFFCGLCMAHCLYRRGYTFIDASWARVVLAAALMGVSVYFFRSLPVLVAVFAGIVSYAVFLGLLQGITRSEKNLVNTLRRTT